MSEKTFKGDPCKYGHDGTRYIIGGGCVACLKTRSSRRHHGLFVGPPKPPKGQLARQRDAHIARMGGPDVLRERENQRRREQRAADPTYRARANVYSRKYEAKDPDATRLRKRGWYHGNPMTRVAQRHRRRATEQSAEGNHSPADLRLIRLLQGGHCAYCPQTEDLHVDHIVPLSRGGSNWPWNLQWLCAYHNTSKGSRTDAEYRQLIGLPVVRPASTAIWMLLLVAV